MRPADFTLRGTKELQRALKELGKPSAVRRAVRPAVRAGTKPIIKAARAKVPTRTGMLKKSLGVKMKTYPRAGVITGIIGPRVDEKYTVTVVDEKGREHVHKPWKIAHLVELGHGGPYPARPHPFLRPAVDSQGPRAMNLLAAKCWVEIKKQVQRERAKAGLR